MEHMVGGTGSIKGETLGGEEQVKYPCEGVCADGSGGRREGTTVPGVARGVASPKESGDGNNDRGIGPGEE